MTKVDRASWVGQPIKRREDRRLLTGKGRYLADLDLPRTAHVAILRSPHAHARLVRIDTTGSQVAEGVLAVVTGRDLVRTTRPFPNRLPFLRPLEYYALAIDRVRFVGEPVAAVVAESAYLAEDALEQIQVEYEPLPVVADLEQAQAPTAPRLYEQWPDNLLTRRTFSVGDV